MHVNKRLIIRLSSLGDVILATSGLGVRARADETHWVVAQKVSRASPGKSEAQKSLGVRSLEADGLSGVVRLCDRLWKEGFTEVLDLHSTMRSQVARTLFSHARENRKAPDQLEDDQQRARQGYRMFALKKFWPEQCLSHAIGGEICETCGWNGAWNGRTSAIWCAMVEQLPPELQRGPQIMPEPTFCVMPSSKWDGKNGVFADFLKCSKTGMVVVLGREVG